MFVCQNLKKFKESECFLKCKVFFIVSLNACEPVLNGFRAHTKQTKKKYGTNTKPHQYCTVYCQTKSQFISSFLNYLLFVSDHKQTTLSPTTVVIDINWNSIVICLFASAPSFLLPLTRSFHLISFLTQIQLLQIHCVLLWLIEVMGWFLRASCLMEGAIANSPMGLFR